MTDSDKNVALLMTVLVIGSAGSWEGNTVDNTDLNTFIEELDDKLKSYEGLRGDDYKKTLRDQYILLRSASIGTT